MRQIALLTILTVACVDYDPPKTVEEPTVIVPEKPVGFAGPDGPQGETGQQGVAGPRGELGPKGPQGEHGETGRQGLQGEVGREGAQGEQGLPGQDGRNGERGFIGRQGSVGPQGERGRDGPRGEVGRQGPQGEVGPQGLQGVDGQMGPQGPVGFQGERGEVGPEGPTGPSGSSGLTGPQGLQGKTGPQGVPGEQGILGSQGPHGERGEQGLRGESGSQGEHGETGLSGSVGPEGPQGLEGDSCDPTDDSDGDGFVDWVEMATNTDPYNSESVPEDTNGDWAPDVLVGPQGLPGETGSMGPQGERGLEGPQGPTWEPPAHSCPEGTEPIFYGDRLVYCFMTFSDADGMNWISCEQTCQDDGLEMIGFEELTKVCLGNPDLLSGDHIYWTENLSYLHTYSNKPSSSTEFPPNCVTDTEHPTCPVFDPVLCGSVCENLLASFPNTRCSRQEFATNPYVESNYASWTTIRKQTYTFSSHDEGMCCPNWWRTSGESRQSQCRTLPTPCPYYPWEELTTFHFFNNLIQSDGDLINFECMCGKKPE